METVKLIADALVLGASLYHTAPNYKRILIAIPPIEEVCGFKMLRSFWWIRPGKTVKAKGTHFGTCEPRFLTTMNKMNVIFQTEDLDKIIAMDADTLALKQCT